MTLQHVRLASFVSYTRDGSELLILDKFQLNKGRLVYVPIGGTVRATAQEALSFCAQTGVMINDFKTPEKDGRYKLRFTSDSLDVVAIRQAFMLQHKRTDTARHTLHRGLVVATSILRSEHLGNPRLRYLRTKENSLDDAQRLCIASIFRLSLPQSATVRILTASTRTPQIVTFASRSEIRAGETSEGIAIASVSRLLLP